MLGLGELAVIIGSGMVVIGPHGFPRFAYSVGHTLGLTVRLLRRTTEAMSSFSRQHQISELHNQLRTGLEDINAIRDEWQRLTNRQVLQSSLLGHHASSLPTSGPVSSSTAATPPPPSAQQPQQQQPERHYRQQTQPQPQPQPQPPQSASSQPTPAPTQGEPRARQSPSSPDHSAMLEMSARTVRTQQRGVAGSDYLNVALASQQMWRAQQLQAYLQQQQQAEEEEQSDQGQQGR